MKKFIFSLAILAVIACNKNESKGEKVVDKAAEISNQKSNFELIDDAGNIVYSVVDNEVFYNSEKLGIITNEHSFKNNKGKIISTYSNNELTINNKRHSKFNLKGDGSFTTESGAFSWNSDGNLLKDNEPAGLKIKPAEAGYYLDASILTILNGEIESVVTQTDEESLAKKKI